MDMKAYIEMSVVKGDNKYSFYLPMGAPFGEAYDAAFEVLKSISEQSKAAVDAAAQKPVEPVSSNNA